MWRRCPGEGVHRVGDRRVPEARSSQQGGGLSACGGWGLPVTAPPHTPRLGPRCPDSLAPAPSPSHPLSHKDFSRWSLLVRRSVAGNCFKRCRWRGLRRTPRAGSRRGRAAAPARGEARPRGPRAARQAARAAPSRPAFLTGLIPPPGGAPFRAGTQRAYCVRPRPGAVTRSLRDSKSADAVACAPRVPPCRRSQAATPRPPGAESGVLHRAAQVRRPR